MCSRLTSFTSLSVAYSKRMEAGWPWKFERSSRSLQNLFLHCLTNHIITEWSYQLNAAALLPSAVPTRHRAGHKGNERNALQKVTKAMTAAVSLVLKSISDLIITLLQLQYVFFTPKHNENHFLGEGERGRKETRMKSYNSHLCWHTRANFVG